MLGLSLGSEFVPKLGEGTIVINTVRLAGVSLEESLDYGTRIERILKAEFPDEIEDDLDADRHRRGRHRPDGPGADRHLHFPETPIELEAGQDAGGTGRARCRRSPSTLPGMRAVYGQPIEERINEMVAGIRADLGIKLFGDDLEVLKEKAAEIDEGRRDDPRRGGRRAPSKSRVSRCSDDRGRSASPVALRRVRAAGARDRSRRPAGSSSARSSSRGGGSRWRSGCPWRTATIPRRWSAS